MDHARQPPAIDQQAGFTLLEVLVVISILGLLIGIVAPAALRQLGGARVSVARQSIERLGSVLDIYQLDIGGYPTTDQGLAALTERPTSVTSCASPEPTSATDLTAAISNIGVSPPIP